MAFNRNIANNGLPAVQPDLEVDSPEILKQLVLASRHLGTLNGLCAAMPDPSILTNTVILQESKDSSEIEGIVTSRDELYEAITGYGKVGVGAMEVLNYTEALYQGMGTMTRRKGVVSINLLSEIVQTIKGSMTGVRTSSGTPMKNMITGETVYMPPEGAPVIREKLGDLERFINDNNYSALDPLIKMAMVHYQFIAISPFGEGDLRTGRILNELYLVQQGLLPMPVLCMSGYIARNKLLYQQLIQGVTEHNNWRDWILYNLAGVAEAAQQTTSKVRRLVSLKAKMEGELKGILGASYGPELLQLMFESPYLKIELLDKRGLAHRQTASTWLKKLTAAGVLTEQKKGKTLYFVNNRLMNILTS